MPARLPPEIIALILSHATRLLIPDQITAIKSHYFNCYINYTDPSPDYAVAVRNAPGTRAKKSLQLVSKECNWVVQRAWGRLLRDTEEGRMLIEMACAL